jgi:hypothetical protein
MKRPKQKYHFIGKLKVEQLLRLDDMRAKVAVCIGEDGKSFGFLIRITPATISLLKKMDLI